MPSTSARILGCWVLYVKPITHIDQTPTGYDLRVLRSRALQEITNSGVRARLARLGLELVVEPDVQPWVPAPELPPAEGE